MANTTGNTRTLQTTNQKYQSCAHSRGTQGEKYLKGNMMLLEMALAKEAVVMVHGGFSTMISTDFPHSMFFGGFQSPNKPNQMETAGTKMPGDQDQKYGDSIWTTPANNTLTLTHFKPQTRNIKAADTQGVLKVRNTLREILCY